MLIIYRYSLKRVGDGLDALKEWFQESIIQRKQKISDSLQENAGDVEQSVQRDVFSRLILSNLSEGKYSLKDNEIVRLPSHLPGL
jgi:hypothetical protein